MGSPLGFSVAQEGPKLRRVGMFEEQHQEALTELEGAGELAEDLPHAVQEQQKDRSLLARLAVGVRRLGTALLEWVTCLGVRIRDVRGVGIRAAEITISLSD